jgi:hypothetical protein
MEVFLVLKFGKHSSRLWGGWRIDRDLYPTQIFRFNRCIHIERTQEGKMPKATIKDLPKDRKIRRGKMGRMREGAETTASTYQTRTDESGQTSIQFGDGASGAQLPNGSASTLADYRNQRDAAGTKKGRRSGRAGRVGTKTRH